MKCLKCNGEMEEGKWSGGAYLNIITEQTSNQGRETMPYICKECGHVEIVAKK